MSERGSFMPTASFPTANGRADEAGEEPEAIPFLKQFTVFNADQREDLPADVSAAAPSPPPENLILPEAEALIRAVGADIRIGGDRAFYVPGADYIQAPSPSAYFEPISLCEPGRCWRVG
jgi:antirestriction protein ArdC